MMTVRTERGGRADVLGRGLPAVEGGATELSYARFASPVGSLVLVGHVGPELSLAGIYFAAARHAEAVDTSRMREEPGAFAAAWAQLEEYFAGTRTSFDVTLAPRGTPFQCDVWRALAAIPYGTTATYAEIARAIGRPLAVRAVGAANGRNPLSIIVPCHRVIGRDGTLTGYAGGIENKRFLLELESRTRA